MSDDVWVDQQRAETRKLNVEADKLNAETRKLVAEQTKLEAEALKYLRDHRLAPWLVLGGFLGYLVGAAAVGARLFGH